MTIDGQECLTIDEFAVRKGVTHGAVLLRIKGGKIPFKKRGKKRWIPLPDADAAWDMGKGANPTLTGEEVKIGSEKKKPGKPRRTTIFERGVASRAERAVTEAKLKDLEYRQKAKDLVRVVDVKKALGEVAGAIRATWENFADRSHVQLASMTDPNEVHKYLLEELDLLMENFSNADKWQETSMGDISGSTETEAEIDGESMGGQEPDTGQAIIG
jgi:hypothetical protein